MINLFFNSLASGSAVSFREKLGIGTERITQLNLELSAGDITAPFEIDRRRDVYRAYFNITNEIRKEIIKLKRLLRSDKKLCLWYSVHDADEYLGMLSVVAEFYGKGVTIYLCDCSDFCEGLADLQFLPFEPRFERKILRDGQAKALLREWEELQRENARVRIIRDGKAVGMPQDYIDDELFSVLGDGEITIRDVCDKMLTDEKKIGFTYLVIRLRELIADGRIIVVKEGYTPKGAHKGRRMKDFIRYTVKAAGNGQKV